MSRFMIAIIGLSVGFFLWSCASQVSVENRPKPKLKSLVLAKDVNTSGKTGVAREPANKFDTEDKQVVALLTFENLTGTHQLRWEWVAPNGKVYLSTKNYPLKAGQGQFLPKVTVWHHISLKYEAAEDFPGKWSVKIYMDDKLIRSKSFIVKAFADSLMLPKGLALRHYPEDWALIIGIEKYGRLPDVAYARKDALIVREYFTRILGVPQHNIIALIDADATKAQIEGYLKTYIPKNIGKNATVYVYYAGHGMPGAEKGEPYLMPYDADTRFIEQTGYKLTSLYQDLDELDVERVYVFLDSCFSGVASRAAEMLVKGSRPALMHGVKVRPPSNSIISLNATSIGQLSHAYPEKRHGLFTYYLLRGMRSDADANDDGWASIKELYGYVRRHVTRRSRRMQSEQIPSIAPSSDQLRDIAVSRGVN